jgi:hypothetical protein
MLYEIKHKNTNKIIYSTKARTVREAVERAVALKVSLSGADLSGAALHGADLSGADLYEANLSWADLREANLRGADLYEANLSWADLREANLSWADLRGADLRGANLHRADLDFSCLPLWCGSFGMQVDSRFVRQLAAHLYRLKCDEPEGQAIQRLLRPARNAFCRDRSDVGDVE